jgi:hypothetical protein
MAGETGISKNTVACYFALFGLQSHRAKSIKLSTDPFFVEKVPDVVGLFLNPPELAEHFPSSLSGRPEFCATNYQTGSSIQPAIKMICSVDNQALSGLGGIPPSYAFKPRTRAGNHRCNLENEPGRWKAADFSAHLVAFAGPRIDDD